jgi:anti-anti-sigma factor
MPTPAVETRVERIADLPDSSQIRIRGRVTLEQAAALRDRLLLELSRTETSRLVLELGEVEAMDTSGAAVLAEVLKAGERRGLRVLLCRPSESVLGIFRLAGFEEVLGKCCASGEETRRRLAESP